MASCDDLWKQTVLRHRRKRQVSSTEGNEEISVG